MSNNENLTTPLQLSENGVILKAGQQIEQLERDLIALLYNIWRITGKRKKIVTVKDPANN